MQLGGSRLLPLSADRRPTGAGQEIGNSAVVGVAGSEGDQEGRLASGT